MSRSVRVRFWFKSPFYYLHALEPLASHLTSLSLSFIICRLGACAHASQGTLRNSLKVCVKR